ncbi:methyltransferase domain-containing protein [Oscillochloris sp. ZM17-4]|uniref:class I SAM-dependent methyltransferase n=1 Tax=Oscillochloris sp. ZM17-4 TaxID=2866714 RepID=UPI001C73BF1B|nr:class I SAM-dependent methyltransferase [Oscillochloris sp. ZM17-4]MBX0330763.1 methyltransferase domain-containing protein [Oscillochloris sp. ZM17-4]
MRAAIGPGYITADLFDPHVDVRLDITRLPQSDQSIDIIYCSHVLEHVPDDRKAMRELYRILKREGWAILLVPITVGQTIEDPTITDPAERLRLFGQDDHVRRYGPDYVDRLREVGFIVDVITPANLSSPEEIVRAGLSPESGEIYYCRRQ